MTTYRTENLSRLPSLTPRTRERLSYTPPDVFSDPLINPRPPSPTYNRRELLELQDKINAYREEISKKDKLIGQLTIHGAPAAVPIRTGSAFTTEARTVDQAYATDYAATKSENARLQAQVHELQVSLDTKEDRLREMKLQLDASRDTETRQAALIQTQRDKLLEYESARGTLEGTASLNELSFQALQQEHREAQQRIIDLEARLRKYAEDKERLEGERNATDTRWLALVGQLRSTLPSSDILIDSTLAPEKLSAKILELVKENTTLRAEKLVVDRDLAATVAERDSHAETVKRLLSGVETDKASTTKQLIDLESARLERDAAVARQKELEAEVTRLTDRLAANQLAFDTMKVELETRVGQERELEGKEVLVRTTESAYKHFKESLAAMLSSGLGNVEPYEEAIRERIKNLMQTLRDKTISIDSMEKKLTTLSQQLEMQYEQQRNAEKRAKKAEADLMDAEDRLRRSQGLVGSGASLHSDRDRFIRFVDRAMRTLGMEAATGEIGLESACDAILERIDRLIRADGEVIHSGRAAHQLSGMQRKIASLQEQLTNKDVHLDLLRRKVTQMEQRFGERSLVDEDTALAQSQTLELVSRYKRELAEAQLEIKSLRAHLAEFHNMRANRMEKDKAILQLETKVGQLENVRHKQSQRIEALKSTVDEKEALVNEKKALAQDSLHALTKEVRNLKTAIRDLRQRERKLLELRQLIAKMLGLDVNLISVADVEIVSRLEKVILAAQSGVAAAPGTVLLEMPPSVAASMPFEFRSGYEEAARVTEFAPPARSRSATRRSPERAVEQRSSSPVKRDTRVY